MAKDDKKNKGARNKMLNYRNIGSIYELSFLSKSSSDIYLLIESHFMDKIDIFSNITTDFLIGVKWIFFYAEKASQLEDIFDSFIERHDLLDIVTSSYGIDEKTELANLFLSKITPTTMGVSILDEKNIAENDLLREILKGINNKNSGEI